jgi:hypothetical protein
VAKFSIIITADYEVFGNGSGSVERCMIAPTQNLLDACNQVNAKLTLFTDVCELWAFEEVEKNGQWDLDYSPSTLIKDQLKKAIQQGHDVQLHFHPQWLDYSYLGNGQWKLNHDKWRLPSLSNEDISGLFKKGKQTLEDLLTPIRPSYVCNVFRAGGWCIQPEEHILEAMKEHGFRIESSVAPGMKNEQLDRFFDFEFAPDLSYWIMDEHLLKPSKGDLVEIPIFTAEVSKLKRAQFLKNRAVRKIPFKPEGCTGFAETTAKTSKVEKLKKVFNEGRAMFNFSDAVCKEEMIYMVKSARKKYADTQQNIPLVMIGHPKTFGNENELKEFLFWAANQNDISFTDYNSFLNEYQSFS